MEFAFALMFVFLVFTAFINLVEVFLAHERLRYATSVAARAESVGGSASKAASKIDQGYTLKTETSGSSVTVSMKKTLDLPQAIGKLFGEKNGFAISHAVTIRKESSSTGDNKAGK